MKQPFTDNSISFTTFLLTGIFICIFICEGPMTFAQKGYNPQDFISPVDHPIILAGSFGELRTNHFHAGLDIKPSPIGSVDSIRNVANGRVSRIKIQAGGYGRAIYIDHPNGYTSVYAHLKTFNDTLEKFIRKIQKEAESYSVDIYPQHHDLIIKQGEVIGLMGNTGRSYAKHLHFEIRETESEIPINPALWGIKPLDNIPPEILSIDVHGLTPEYQLTTKETFYTKRENKGKYALSDNSIRIPAWRCGVAIQTFDRMNGATNRNGVYQHKMYVDDTLYYGYSMKAVSFDETKYINSHIDFPTRKKENRTLIRCYKLPGNALSIYDTVRNDGIIKLYKDIPRNIRLVVNDIEGNTSETSFSIYRDEVMTSKGLPSFNLSLNPHTRDTISIGGFEAIVPSNALDKTYFINYGLGSDQDNRSILSLADKSFLLFNAGKISHELPSNMDNRSKAVIAYSDGEEWSSLGGKIQANKVESFWKSGGQFRLAIDTVAPTIQILSKKKTFTSGEVLSVNIWDTFGNTLNYRVEIDGLWHLSPYKEMTRRLTIPLYEELSRGKHEIVIRAWDDRGNQNEKIKNIIIL